MGGNPRDILREIEDADSIHITGACYSACTLVLLPRFTNKVTWSDDARFGFHAVKQSFDDSYIGVVDSKATEQIFGDLPPALLNVLPPLEEWNSELIILNGKEVDEILNN